MTVVFAILVTWVVLVSLLVIAWHLYTQTARARAQTQLDYFAAVDAMSTRAHTNAMDAFARVTRDVQDENRKTLSEIVALVHGPEQPPDADLDQPDPALEMNGPWGVSESEMVFRDPTDDALPDEEILGYGTRAVMESDVVIDR